jgi:hypothetical protein
MRADLAYYRRRAAGERLAAAGADNPRVRSVHLELARQYDERLKVLTDERGHAGLSLVPAA